MSETRGKGTKSWPQSIIYLTYFNSNQFFEGRKGRRENDSNRNNAMLLSGEHRFASARWGCASNPTPNPGKYPLVTVTHLCFVSASPGHDSYHLKSKSATWSWSSTLLSVLGSLTFGQTGMPGMYLLIFVIRASVLGDKSRWRWMLTNLAYVCPWASQVGHPYLTVLEWDSDPQLGMRDSPRVAAWAGLGWALFAAQN